MNAGNGIYRLIGQVQHYAWGGHEFIPDLLGLDPRSGTPFAEYWLGAHAKAPSKVVLEDGGMVDLDKLIREHPQRILGPRVTLEYGQLPYLLKILDVENPLSIQVHPTKHEAEAGFERENTLGMPLDAPERNYRDDNHKPELMVALGDFWLLHGFLPEAQLLSALKNVPELHPLLGVFEDSGYSGLYKNVMNMPPEEVDATLAPLAKRVLEKRERGGLEKSTADYWMAKVVAGRRTEHYDRGIFSIYFLNLVCLRKGQAIFQDAGIPHAYLQGQNVELMANSDNVLRAGLTQKHVDVTELLRIVRFEGVHPRAIRGSRLDNPLEAVYQGPIGDFRLGRVQLTEGSCYATSTHSTEILLMLDGEAALVGGEKQIHVSRGQSAVVFAGTVYQMTALSEEVTLFRASIPLEPATIRPTTADAYKAGRCRPAELGVENGRLRQGDVT